MSGLPITSQPTLAPAVVPRGKIIMMGVIAGAVITNIYCTQPILPLIASDMGVDVTTVDLVAGSALLGFGTGLALLLPMGDRFDRRKLVLGQIALALCFALAAAFAPSIWALIVASFGLGIVCCVPQQLVPFAAVMSQPHERGRNVGTVVSGIMVGILLGRTIAGVVGEAYGWRAVYAIEAAFMIPVWIAAARWLPRGVPSTNLSYPRLLASLWPLMRDNSPIRQSMMVQALLWACFNAFWVNLAALLAHGPWQLGSAWAGGFGIIGAVGALAALTERALSEGDQLHTSAEEIETRTVELAHMQASFTSRAASQLTQVEANQVNAAQFSEQMGEVSLQVNELSQQNVQRTAAQVRSMLV